MNMGVSFYQDKFLYEVEESLYLFIFAGEILNTLPQYPKVLYSTAVSPSQ